MSLPLKWVDPPARRYLVWSRIIAELEARPGIWAHVFTGKNSHAAQSRTYSLRQRYPTCEWAVRNREVFARFVGEQS